MGPDRLNGNHGLVAPLHNGITIATPLVDPAMSEEGTTRGSGTPPIPVMPRTTRWSGCCTGRCRMS
jgi:hypothetical protein